MTDNNTTHMELNAGENNRVFRRAMRTGSAGGSPTGRGRQLFSPDGRKAGSNWSLDLSDLGELILLGRKCHVEPGLLEN